MISVAEAFKKFKSNLELNKSERENASKRQSEVRDLLSKELNIDNSFLTGSYSRHTHSKPLKDIDIFFVLSSNYRHCHPNDIITKFYDILSKEYGSNAVKKQSHSVSVDFGVVHGFAADEEDNTDHRVVSVDCVPAFKKGSSYEIPDRTSGGRWIETNPEIHAERATQKHQGYSEEWKGLVRMVKYWNSNSRHGEKPIKPSFLIEVMAMDCLYGGWQPPYEYEIKEFFATLHSRIHEDWPDPAGLGPPVSDAMDRQKVNRAQAALAEADRDIAHAIHLAKSGKNAEALKAWRKFFGPKFPLS